MKRVAKQSIYIYYKDCLIDVNRRHLNGLASIRSEFRTIDLLKGDFRGVANNSENPMSQ